MERTVDDKTLDELMAAHAASHQGEWSVRELPGSGGEHPVWWVECDERDEHTEGTVTVAECLWRGGADARFIALAHNTVPHMVAELRQCREDLHTIHNSPILRMCTMPGCLRQFDIRSSVSGDDPKYPHWSSEGWVSAGQFGHVCPDHREAVQEHRPRWGIPSLGAPRTATCACGWFLEQESTFNGFGIASWRNHLAMVYRSIRNEEKE